MTKHAPSLLLVDDRPSSFTRYVLSRTDVKTVLLRFETCRGDLPPDYLKATTQYPCFWVQDGVPLEVEAARYLREFGAVADRPQAFCNPSEPRQALAQAFASLVGLPHLTTVQVDWVRNKVAMKGKLRELGLDTAEYAAVGNKDDVSRFARRHGWPVVLKPVDSFACIDTYLVPDETALTALQLPDRAYMVEAYLPGLESEHCALIFKGAVLDVWSSAMPARPLSILDGAINANISAATGEASPVGIRALMQRIVTGMGLDHGYMHMEVFQNSNNQGVHVGEIGVRLAGCEITANHGYAYGFDVFRAVLDVYLGKCPSLTYTRRICAGDLLLPLPQSGTVLRVTDALDIGALPGVVAVVLKIKPGDAVKTMRASHASSGYVHVVGASVDQVEERMRTVLDMFTIDLVAVPAAH